MTRYEEHIKRRAAFRRRLLRARDRRLPGRRPRDPASERVLSRLMVARYRRWLASGRLERLGPRRWRFNPHIPDLAQGAPADQPADDNEAPTDDTGATPESPRLE